MMHSAMSVRACFHYEVRNQDFRQHTQFKRIICRHGVHFCIPSSWNPQKWTATLTFGCGYGRREQVSFGQFPLRPKLNADFQCHFTYGYSHNPINHFRSVSKFALFWCQNSSELHMPQSYYNQLIFEAVLEKVEKKTSWDRVYISNTLHYSVG